MVRDRKTEKSKGFAFVSLTEKNDYIAAMKELDGKYVGNRPIKLKPSKWADKAVGKGYGLLNSRNQANQIAESKRQRITEYDGKEAAKRETSAMVAKYAHLIGE